MSEETVKPPPIVVGVQGIDAFRGHQEPIPAKPPWECLVKLPAFEMFMREVYVNNGHVAELNNDLFRDYCDWHKAKGYWPKEDPLGRLIE